jgi:16S rRNA (cytosine967-C5)-methyltransferase
VPAHAAANETVELVRGAGLERAVGFTNAVMRRLAVGLRDLLDGLPEGTPAEAALRHSYPDWIAETWWRDLGRAEALELMRAQNRAPARAVRLNRRRIPEHAVLAGAADPDLPDAVVVDRIPDDWLVQGLAWPQSRGSQRAGLAVGSQPGERVLDLCAAPGGKATQLEGKVVAVERHPGRARELEATVARLGAGNVRVVCADGTALPPELTGFDRALVDAPCSGLGTLASRPDQRWRAQPIPDIQLDLLRAARHASGPADDHAAVCTMIDREPGRGRRVGAPATISGPTGLLPAPEPA